MVVTNKRFIRRTGIIARNTEEISVGQIEEANVQQSAVGRILGYGSVRFRGTGGGIILIKTFASPAKFQQSLRSVMN